MSLLTVFTAVLLEGAFKESILDGMDQTAGKKNDRVSVCMWGGGCTERLQ